MKKTILMSLLLVSLLLLIGCVKEATEDNLGASDNGALAGQAIGFVCRDNDGGKNQDVGGIVTVGSGSSAKNYPDRCVKNQVQETYCNPSSYGAVLLPCSTGKNCVDADGATGPLPASCAVCPSIVNSCEGASLIKTTTTENCAAVREVTDCPTQIDGLISTCTSLTTSTGQSAACGKCGVKICNVAGNDYFSSENNICYNGIDTGRIVSGLGCSVSCSDSDASSTDTKGILTVTLGDGRTLTYQDSCDDSFNPSRVKEYYCLNNLAKNVLIGDSNKHCLDGILVPLN